MSELQSVSDLCLSAGRSSHDSYSYTEVVTLYFVFVYTITLVTLIPGAGA